MGTQVDKESGFSYAYICGKKEYTPLCKRYDDYRSSVNTIMHSKALRTDVWKFQGMENWQSKPSSVCFDCGLGAIRRDEMIRQRPTVCVKLPWQRHLLMVVISWLISNRCAGIEKFLCKQNASTCKYTEEIGSEIKLTNWCITVLSKCWLHIRLVRYLFT